MLRTYHTPSVYVCYSIYPSPFRRLSGSVLTAHIAPEEASNKTRPRTSGDSYPPRHFLYSDAIFLVFALSLDSLASCLFAFAWSSSSFISANSALLRMQEMT